MSQSNTTAEMPAHSARRFVLIALVIVVLAAAAIYFAPGMFADTNPAPAQIHPAVVSNSWSDTGARVAGLAASSRSDYLDAGASVPYQRLAAAGPRSVVAASGYLYSAAPSFRVPTTAGNSGTASVWSDVGTSPRNASRASKVCMLPNGMRTIANC